MENLHVTYMSFSSFGCASSITSGLQHAAHMFPLCCAWLFFK